MKNDRRGSKVLIPILMVGTFAILSTEMSAVGILPTIADRFGLSITEAGVTVSLFAAVVMVSALITPLIASRFERKRMMLLVLAVFVAGNVCAAFASDFATFLVARTVPAVVHPIYCSLALTVAAEVAAEGEVSRNVSKVIMGVSSGMILGTPIVTFMAGSISFEAAMLFLAAVCLVVLLATVAFMTPRRSAHAVSYAGQVGILKRPAVVVSLIATMLFSAGVYGVYSYISEILESFTGIDPSMLSAVLLVFGLMSLGGNYIAGRLLSKGSTAYRLAVVSPIVLALVYVLVFSVGNMVVPMLLIILVWGMANGIANNIQQFLIVSVGQDAPEFSNGLFLSLGNMGITIGISVCGAIMGSQVVDSVYGGWAFLALALVMILVRQALISRAGGNPTVG